MSRMIDRKKAIVSHRCKESRLTVEAGLYERLGEGLQYAHSLRTQIGGLTKLVLTVSSSLLGAKSTTHYFLEPAGPLPLDLI